MKTIIGYIISATNVETGKPQAVSGLFESASAAYAEASHRDVNPSGSFTEYKVTTVYDEYTVTAEEARNALRADYYSDVRELAESLAHDLQTGEISSADQLEDMLTESCDSHRRVIYTGRAIETLSYSDNDDNGIIELGQNAFDWVEGIPWSQLAFYAFMADVRERMEADGVNFEEPFQCADCEVRYTDRDDLTEVEEESGSNVLICSSCVEDREENEN